MRLETLTRSQSQLIHSNKLMEISLLNLKGKQEQTSLQIQDESSPCQDNHLLQKEVTHKHGVMRGKIGWPFKFMVVFHCLWVWKGRTDVSERVCGLGRGPWQQKYVGFGVRQAAGSPRFQLNDGVLRLEMR